MQVVIDISEKMYEDCKVRNTGHYSSYDFSSMIAGGAVLPKGHGDLIDRKELKKVINQFECYDQVLDAPAIIKADKGE